MNISNNTKEALDILNHGTDKTLNNKNGKSKISQNKNSLEKVINNSSTKISISKNAQFILYQLNSSIISKGNLFGQASLSNPSSNNQDILDFLSGKFVNDSSLSDIGYDAKPILELSQEEATKLVSDDGFFGITQTSNRVAAFVLNFSGDDIELLEKGREGIVKGFEEAEKLFGGKLPNISYKTQEITLALIDEKINSLKQK